MIWSDENVAWLGVTMCVCVYFVVDTFGIERGYSSCTDALSRLLSRYVSSCRNGGHMS